MTETRPKNSQDTKHQYQDTKHQYKENKLQIEMPCNV